MAELENISPEIEALIRQLHVTAIADLRAQLDRIEYGLPNLTAMYAQLNRIESDIQTLVDLLQRPKRRGSNGQKRSETAKELTDYLKRRLQDKGINGGFGGKWVMECQSVADSLLSEGVDPAWIRGCIVWATDPKYTDYWYDKVQHMKQVQLAYPQYVEARKKHEEALKAPKPEHFKHPDDYARAKWEAGEPIRKSEYMRLNLSGGVETKFTDGSQVYLGYKKVMNNE